MARLGLLTAATVIFYLQLAPLIDVVLPLVGCILRPMIVVFFLTTFFHLQSLEIIAPTLFGSALYSFLIVCPFGWISMLFVPVSLLYVIVYIKLRNKVNPIINFTISGVVAGILYLLIIAILLPGQVTAVLAYFPVVIMSALLFGLIQARTGRVHCSNCPGCG